MYVIGNDSTIEYYDPQTNKWNSVENIIETSYNKYTYSVSAFALDIESNIRQEHILKYYS